jgi:tripartite-type tricarboxylate transporter receptor subunit TctC
MLRVLGKLGMRAPRRVETMIAMIPAQLRVRDNAAPARLEDPSEMNIQYSGARLRMIALLAALIAPALSAYAQTKKLDGPSKYPVRPVRVIVPYSPGGSSDAVARVVSAKMPEVLGQPFVIDNRPGAAGSLGRELVAKAAPDGYTLLIGDSPHTINVHVLKHVPYDPIRDFTPITLLATAPQVFVVHPAVPAKTLKEFIALAASQPGKLNYGSGGSGSITHLTGELFKLAAKIDLVHVPYKSIANAVTDVIGNQIPAAFPTIPGATPHVKAGRLRGLGITSTRRSTMLAEVPTFEEGGVSGMIVTNWFGVFGPARLPQDVLAKLHKSVVEVVQAPDGKAKFSALSLEVAASSPKEFETHLKAELEKWGRVVKAAGIRPE